MGAEICAGLAAVFLVLAVHPFVTYPLTLQLMRPRRRGASPVRRRRSESFAICVCAYNEEAVIERKVRNMLDLRERAGALEILVYVDAATDRTAELLRPFEDEITVMVSPRRLGKTYGMNLLLERATASVVMFTDANVIIDPGAIEALAVAFDDPDVGCVCGHLIYVNEDGTPTSAVGSLYWRLEERIKDLESAAGAAMGADGSLFAIRRQLHRPVPPRFIDDMYLSLSVLCDGYRVVRAARAIAYEESVTATVEEFRRKVRIACQAFNVHRHLWPRLSRLPPLHLYMYLSHKLLRWLSIYSFGLAAISGAAACVLLGVPAVLVLSTAVVAALLVWWGSARRVTPLAQLGEILTALLGAGVGVAESLLGRQYRTWTPATSIRQTSD